jgi:hypothetical protein
MLFSVGLAVVIKKSTVAPLINAPNVTLNLPLTKNPINILPGSGIYTPLEGTWKLIAFKDLYSGNVETQPERDKNLPAKNKDIRITFNKEENNKGTLSGHTINNAIFGDYELERNNKINMKIGGTKVREPEWGNKFWDEIHKIDKYRLEENALFLYYNDNQNLMEFVKVDQTSTNPEPDQPKSDQSTVQVESDLITYFENHSEPKNPVRINNIGDLRERRIEFYNLIKPNNFPSIWKGEKPVNDEENTSFIRVRLEGTVKLHSDVSREWLRKHYMDCIPAEKGQKHIILTDESGAVSLYGDDADLSNFLNKKVEVTGFYAEGMCEGPACYCYPGIFVKSFSSK